MNEHIQCKDLDFLTVPWQERATWLRCGVLRVQCSSSTVQRRNTVIQCRGAEKCTQTPTQHRHSMAGLVGAMMQWRGAPSIVATTQSCTEAQCSSEHLVVHWAGAQHQGIGVGRNTEGVCPSLTRLGTWLVLHELSLKGCLVEACRTCRDIGKRKTWCSAEGIAGCSIQSQGVQ